MSRARIGPVHIALGQKLSDDLQGGFELDPPVGSVGVIPDEPVHEFVVELGQIGVEEVLVKVHEFLLQGSVESFGVGIEVGLFGIGEPVTDAFVVEVVMKFFHELTAVIGQDDLDGVREDGFHEVHDAFGVTAGEVADADGKGKAALEVGAGDQVSPDVIPDPVDGIQGDTLTRVEGGKAGRFPGLLDSQGFGTPPRVDSAGCMAHLVGGIGNDSSHASDTGTGKLSGLAEGLKKPMEFFFAQIGVEGTQPADL